MKHDTAGDPITGLKWTHRTTAKIALELRSLGIQVSANTVAKLLNELGFSLRVNHKKKSNGSHQDRDAQFACIKVLRERCVANRIPLISVDTKKRELVGLFKNSGRAWNQAPVEVNDHDFRSDALGIAIPYGIYDLQANHGMVFVGTSYDTPQFAAESIEKWWRFQGLKRYTHAEEIAILADCGGSNGSRTRAWKYNLQHKLSNRHGLTVTVAHYPPGTSKWNPIEHRLFSEISKNWAGHPLNSYETVLKHLRTTSTTTGLRVTARLVKKQYEKGVKITDAQMRELGLTKAELLPQWNYSLSPTELGSYF